MNVHKVLNAIRGMAAAKVNITDDVIKSCLGKLTTEELDALALAIEIGLSEGTGTFVVGHA